MLKKIKSFAKNHKIIAIISAVIIIGCGYLGIKAIKGNANPALYVLAAVQKGTVIASVSGSGQVSAENQLDIKPKVSGNLVYLNAQNNQVVKAGTLLAQLNSSDAQKSVRDAQANLESAKLSMQKLQQPADQLALLQAENALIAASEAKQSAKDDLIKTYNDGFSNVTDAFLDLPAIMIGLQNILFGNVPSGIGQQYLYYYADAAKNYDAKILQYRDDAYGKYQTARSAYDKNFQNYKAASRFSDNKTVEELIDETYNTSKNIAEALKSANNLIQFYEDILAGHNLNPQSFAATHLNSLNSYTGQANGHLVNLLSSKTKTETDKQTIVNSDRAIAERAESLANLKAGADALDLASQELTIKQRENALFDAKEKLADYFIRAPFDGVIAAVNVKKGDEVSASTAILTIITTRRIAEISLNEVDAAKIKTGQKVTLTFDAVADLGLSGQVIQIDSIGTVSQGVVNYNVKIGFDTQDERIKPGMSVSTAIITNVKQDVLTVPNSAIKTQNNRHYVEIFNPPLDTAAYTSQGIASAMPPVQQTVEIGLANETLTEIISGLKENDQVVSRTINSPAKTTSTTQAPSLFGGGNAGGAVRIPRN